LTTEFAYNGDGVRTRKTVGGHTTQYVLDLATTLPAVSSDTDGVYLYGLDIIAQQQAERQYYMHDGLGSVRQLLDSTGEIETSYAYDPFGVPVMGGDGSNPYQFTGEAWDAEVELLYLRARYYQPEVGRFITKDPWAGELQRPATLNLYAYARNNPFNLVDPTGLDGADPLALRERSAVYDAIDPLTHGQWRLSKQEAARFQIPVELVAGAIAVEIVKDTDWWDSKFDAILEWGLEVRDVLQQREDVVPRSRQECRFLSDILTYWEHWGAEEQGPGPGVANFHVGTAKKVEQYFAEEYPTDDPNQSLLPTPPDPYVRMELLLAEPWNIRYTAAYLRQLADLRKGTDGKPLKGPHVNDLSDLDMQVIFGGFRTGVGPGDRLYSTVGKFQEAKVPGETYGPMIEPFLRFYRSKLSLERWRLLRYQD
jgi:RHS repeat-associated protein